MRTLRMILMCAPRPAALALVLPALLASGPLAADPLKSQACGDAVAALEAMRAAPPPDARALEAARGHAARVCLGAADSPDRPARVLAAPVQVSPPALQAPAPARVLVTPPVAPPAPAYEPPPVVTACDAGGCWDSAGRRLNRSGPLLTGPGGACVPQGVGLACP